jgi:hypothetical protein
MQTLEHPAFERAKALTEPYLRAHFPKSIAEAREFKPILRSRVLGSRVLAVAQTRVECAWAAYVDAVPGYNHQAEEQAVLAHGDKLQEGVARALFPNFDDVPYAG